IPSRALLLRRKEPRPAAKRLASSLPSQFLPKPEGRFEPCGKKVFALNHAGLACALTAQTRPATGGWIAKRSSRFHSPEIHNARAPALHAAHTLKSASRP